MSLVRRPIESFTFFSTTSLGEPISSSIYTSPAVSVPLSSHSSPVWSNIKPAAMSTVVESKQHTENEKLSIDRLCDLFQLHSAPEIDLEVFKGDPLEFSFFMTSFQEVVEKKVKD